MYVKTYSVVISLQCALLLIDLLVNSFSYLFWNNQKLFVSICILQDVSIIVSFFLLIFGIYSATYDFQSSNVSSSYGKYRAPMSIILVHFILCVSKHIFIQKYQQYTEWPRALTVLYIGQRLFSPIYYYVYKSSSFLFLSQTK